MKINLDRLCRLAGVKSSDQGTINEASNRSLNDDPALSDEAEYRFGKNQLAEGEADEEGYMPEDEESDVPPLDEYLDEVIEIDEAMLVQELRRAKAMMSEARKAKQEELFELSETQLRHIVSNEVSSIMKDFNLSAGWVYGDDKPTRSKKGQIVTSMPGVGFKSFNK